MAKTYKVTGMTCGGCARSVESAIKAALPAAEVRVNLEQAQVVVDKADDDAAVQRAVTDAGFTYAGTV